MNGLSFLEAMKAENSLTCHATGSRIQNICNNAIVFVGYRLQPILYIFLRPVLLHTFFDSLNTKVLCSMNDNHIKLS